MNLRHLSRRPIGQHLVMDALSRKPLAAKVQNGLALLRRARGKSEQR
jgi:hypothetical protein